MEGHTFGDVPGIRTVLELKFPTGRSEFRTAGSSQSCGRRIRVQVPVAVAPDGSPYRTLRPGSPGFACKVTTNRSALARREAYKMIIERKGFLSAILFVLTSAVASCAGRPVADSKGERFQFYRVLSPKEYDYQAMMAVIRNPTPHKQVFMASSTPGQAEGALHLLHVALKPDVSALFQHMQLAMNGYNFSLESRGESLATLGVLSGSAVVLGLNDKMWEKYDIGRNFSLPKTNQYYRATSNLDPNASPNDPAGLYQDWSAQAVIARGGSFMVCHNALTNVANGIARSGNMPTQDAVEDMAQNLLPGFMLVPAGVTAVQLAQEHGWRLYPS